eukprot:6176741-Pleurochrysis_carterae.AAC.2
MDATLGTCSRSRTLPARGGAHRAVHAPARHLEAAAQVSEQLSGGAGPNPAMPNSMPTPWSRRRRSPVQQIPRSRPHPRRRRPHPHPYSPVPPLLHSLPRRCLHHPPYHHRQPRRSPLTLHPALLPPGLPLPPPRCLHQLPPPLPPPQSSLDPPRNQTPAARPFDIGM